MTFAVLSDPAREAIRAYGVDDTENGIAWPAVFVIKNGAVSWRSLAEAVKLRPTASVVLAAVK